MSPVIGYSFQMPPITGMIWYNLVYYAGIRLLVLEKVIGIRRTDRQIDRYL